MTTIGTWKNAVKLTKLPQTLETYHRIKKYYLTLHFGITESLPDLVKNVLAIACNIISANQC